jgi:AcrR family transcriptional regulator
MSMGSKEDQRERAIRLLAATLLEKGLAETSLRQLAKAADILASTLSRIALEMTVLLTDAIPENANLPPVDFIAAATAVTQAPVMRPYMRLWIEIIAVAARGEQPYSAVANQVTTGFLGWIETRLAGEASETKRSTAAMIFAMIDGLAILDMCAGEGQSAMAARAFKALRFA